MTVCYVNSIVFWELAIQPTPDWKGGAAVAVVGELVEPQAMEPKGGTLESGEKCLHAIFTREFYFVKLASHFAKKRRAVHDAIGLQKGKNCMEFDRPRSAGHS